MLSKQRWNLNRGTISGCAQRCSMKEERIARIIAKIIINTKRHGL
jgi:hypothetical protein